MVRIIAINNYVIVGDEVMLKEAKKVVSNFMHDKSRRREQRPVLFIQSGDKDREMWLRGEWDRMCNGRAFDWEQL